ncbi:DNA polymerase epsilon noncatalytic subunit [Aspergillus saccharolyticus JOP 1030-1]|uniref:DNA polymerase epsilon subunit B n=1 Tax=Aspergillus saccharolyticus JOP 1030-1 TaxID=1450539 RepID=A0A319A6W4_9EURO|nr:hypothetical protein BP01DRAFT_195738 [Aspergillus saccharolyticus JOP 1030-1]PYH47718.1 hypothetical protein BP01DRAFT_195738 [Aspergillus saccharolyticus JOP 1030-1]
MDIDPVPSSSPGFGTPLHAFRKTRSNPPSTRTSILPILLPPSTLRPVAFRTFTRKHNLTISSSALQTLASFVGKNCGSGWREEGLAERVLDEVAKSWRRAGGGVIVDEGKGASLKAILQVLEGNMSGGRLVAGKNTPIHEVTSSKLSPNLDSNLISETVPGANTREGGESEEGDLILHPRRWLKVIEAFDIPRLTYHGDMKHFEIAKSKPSLFPAPSHKTALFRDRYNIVHQRLLRSESFQTSSGLSSHSLPSRTLSTGYKLTPIANLLGRSGTSHLILGLLSVSPTGELSLSDQTGSIVLDLGHARIVPEDGSWLVPGMFALVDGIYEQEGHVKGSSLGGNSGVGGAIGGRFIGISICGPPCERRDITLGTRHRQSNSEISSSGGLGWVDFLGVGSERARGPRMRQIQAQYLQTVHNNDGHGRRLKIAIMSEVNLDSIGTLEALKTVFNYYSKLNVTDIPVAFVLIGNFVQEAIINSSGQAGSIVYKEYFDALSLTLSEFPLLLQQSTFVFVPGDNDPWSSAFSTGAASTVPRHAIPELFTTRVKRVFATANAHADRSKMSEPPGEAIWTSNPARLTLFGPLHDIAIFRDDISSRLRRTSIKVGSDAGLKTIDPDENSGLDFEDQSAPRTQHTSPESNAMKSITAIARKLVKTILDQGILSPFPLPMRPVLWDYVSSLQLYPLPTALILADSESVPFCITYEGCHVMNPGRLFPENGLSSVQWIEYDVLRNRGRVREERF